MRQMKKKFVWIAMAALLPLAASPRLCRAQTYGIPLADSGEPLSGPLLNSTALGTAPVPSTEIAPGSADLLTPTVHVLPFDPIGSSIESTTLTPDTHEESESAAAGAVDTLIPDAALAMRGGRSASPEVRSPLSSLWEIRPTPRGALAGSAAQRLSRQEEVLANLAPTGSAALDQAGRLPGIAASTWEPLTPAQATRAASSAWIPGGLPAQRHSPKLSGSELFSSLGTPESALQMERMQRLPGQPAGQPETTVHSRGAALSSGYGEAAPSQSNGIGNFEDSTTGTTSAPPMDQTRRSSLLWSRAASPVDAPAFADLSTQKFLNPTLTPPLLSGNSLSEIGATPLERERRNMTGVNGAQSRLQSRSGNRLEQSELPAMSRRLQRERRNRYRNPILEQMERQSSADR